IRWVAQTNVHYQLEATSEFPTGTNTPVWIELGPEVIGPTNFQTDVTTTIQSQRFYRVKAPWVIEP
ncbi:MAG: hypothetical protein NZ739_04365, partial [Verrucomicrobiae bacterium]|nr:hypothetical protein [Verrucomicrobiae bacterium]